MRRPALGDLASATGKSKRTPTRGIDTEYPRNRLRCFDNITRLELMTHPTMLIFHDLVIQMVLYEQSKTT